MFARSIRFEMVVLMGTLLVGCGGNDDKPSNSDSGGGDGSINAAGASDAAGAAGKTSTGGSQGGGGAASGGTTQAGGMTGSGTAGMEADGGQPATGGDPPALEGDCISWTWNGVTYTANKNPHSGFYPAVERVNISAADTEGGVPPNQFTLHLMPDKVGTFQCKDYVDQTDSSFSIVWQTFDNTMNPPNPGFTYSPELPCEFTITRADSGENSGDVFEGTFTATLHFPLGTPDYGPKDRSVVGTMRLTKP